MPIKNTETCLSNTLAQPAHYKFIVSLLNRETHNGQNTMMVGHQFVQIADSLSSGLLKEVIRKINDLDTPPLPANHTKKALDTLEQLENYVDDSPNEQSKHLAGDWNFLFNADKLFQRSRIFRNLAKSIPELQIFTGRENGILQKTTRELWVIENGLMRSFEEQDNDNPSIQKNVLFFAINESEQQAYIYRRNNPGPLIGSGYEVVYHKIETQPEISYHINEYRT